MYGAVGHRLPGTGEGGRKEDGPFGKNHSMGLDERETLSRPCPYSDSAQLLSLIHSFMWVLLCSLQHTNPPLRNWDIHHKVMASFMSPVEKGRGKRYLKTPFLSPEQRVQVECEGYRCSVLDTASGLSTQDLRYFSLFPSFPVDLDKYL